MERIQTVIRSKGSKEAADAAERVDREQKEGERVMDRVSESEGWSMWWGERASE